MVFMLMTNLLRISIFYFAALISSAALAQSEPKNEDMKENTENQLTIEIWSDVACPFCYIGKANFEKALAAFPDKEHVAVVWKSFILDPTLPDLTDKTLISSLSEKKGMSIEQTVQMTARVHEMALGSGIEMDFDKALPVNTFHAHRVLQKAKKLGKGSEMKERLFKAYFTEGVNIADHKVLEKLAAEVGISGEDVHTALTESAFADAVNADVQEARSFGISGVPYFVIDRKYGISGAQPVQTFDNALQQAFAEWEGDVLSETKASADGAACTPEGECD